MDLVNLKMQIPVTLKTEDFFASEAKRYGYNNRMKGEKTEKKYYRKTQYDKVWYLCWLFMW